MPRWPKVNFCGHNIEEVQGRRINTLKKRYLLSFLMTAISGGFLFWFFANPGEATSNEAFQKWSEERQISLAKQKLMEVEIFSDKFHFDSLEVIYVGPGEPYFSWWGHLLLRFVGSGNSPERDFTVGFVADFNDFPLNKYKGLMGGYTVMSKIDTLVSYYRDYVEKDKREFVRYPLSSTQNQRELLKENLKSWIKDPTIPGSYSFSKNNCVGLLANLLEDSQFRIKGHNSFFPSDFIKNLTSMGILYQSGKTTGLVGAFN